MKRFPLQSERELTKEIDEILAKNVAQSKKIYHQKRTLRQLQRAYNALFGQAVSAALASHESDGRQSVSDPVSFIVEQRDTEARRAAYWKRRADALEDEHQQERKARKKAEKRLANELQDAEERLAQKRMYDKKIAEEMYNYSVASKEPEYNIATRFKDTDRGLEPIKKEVRYEAVAEARRRAREELNPQKFPTYFDRLRDKTEQNDDYTISINRNDVAEAVEEVTVLSHFMNELESKWDGFTLEEKVAAAAQHVGHPGVGAPICEKIVAKAYLRLCTKGHL